MQKGICPNCQNVVEVQEEATIQTCPHCQKDYLTSQARKLFELMYSQHFSNGNIALNTAMNYDKALVEYEKLLALDSESLDAIFGISLSKINLAKLGQDVIPEIIAFIDTKLQNISTNETITQEMARYLLALGSRYDAYVERSKEVLKANYQYLDEGAKTRFLEMVESGMSLWNFIVAHLAKLESQDELNFSRERLAVLREIKKEAETVETISLGTEKYNEIKSREVFENRIALFKARISFAIAQFVFVVGAIIGFSIMMTNYGTNPFPGLIVLGVFSVLFIVANIGGRITKSKLSK